MVVFIQLTQLAMAFRTDLFHYSNCNFNLSFKIYKGGGGCGRFWNMPILEICSLHKRLSRIFFCMVRDNIPKRNFCFIFKIAAKSPKTANFDALTLSNVFLMSNCYKINFKIKSCRWNKISLNLSAIKYSKKKILINKILY